MSPENNNIEKRKKKKFMDFAIKRIEKILVKNRFFAKFYSYFFKKMTIDEFKIVDLQENSKVVNIGCGSIPHTLLILAREKKWSFIGIDKDKNAVKSAEKMIKTYNLANRIKVEYSKGEDFSYSGFDLIIVSYGVEPKKDLLKKIGNSMDDHSVILYRTTWDSLDKIYGLDIIPKNLKVKETYDRTDGIKAVLLMKNKTNK